MRKLNINVYDNVV